MSSARNSALFLPAIKTASDFPTPASFSASPTAVYLCGPPVDAAQFVLSCKRGTKQ